MKRTPMASLSDKEAYRLHDADAGNLLQRRGRVRNASRKDIISRAWEKSVII